MTGLPLDRLVPPTLLNPKIFQEFLDTGYRLTGAETQAVDDQGREHTYINNLTGEVEDGCLLRVWGVRREITQQTQAEKEVRQSEAKLRAIFRDDGRDPDHRCRRALPGDRAYQPGAPVPASLRDAGKDRPRALPGRAGRSLPAQLPPDVGNPPDDRHRVQPADRRSGDVVYCPDLAAVGRYRDHGCPRYHPAAGNRSCPGRGRAPGSHPEGDPGHDVRGRPGGPGL